MHLAPDDPAPGLPAEPPRPTLRISPDGDGDLNVSRNEVD